MFFLRRHFGNTTLVARRREHFRAFLAIFLVAQLSPRRGVLVNKNSLASCQRCGHSVGLWSAESVRLQVGWAQVSTHICWCWSTGSHKRKVTLLEAPTETLLFYYKDIKQEIVHTLLLEEYGLSKKWVIIMNRRQDLTWLRLQQEKVYLRLRTVTVRLRTVTVPEVLEDTQRNSVQTKKNRNYDNYVTWVDIHCF